MAHCKWPVDYLPGQMCRREDLATACVVLSNLGSDFTQLVASTIEGA